VPDDRAELAVCIAARDPVLRFPTGGAARDLHDECDRVRAQLFWPETTVVLTGVMGIDSVTSSG